MAKIIEQISKRQVYKNNYFRIYDDIVKFPNGKKGTYTKIIEGSAGKAVVVIPCISDRVALIRIYRYSAAKWQWEFPRGLVEKGESLIQGAKRELSEETGLKARKLTHVGSFYPNDGLISTLVHVYLAKGFPKNAEINVQREEGIDDLKLFTMRTLLQMISQGQIMDGFTLSSLFLARIKMLI